MGIESELCDDRQNLTPLSTMRMMIGVSATVQFRERPRRQRGFCIPTLLTLPTPLQLPRHAWQ